MPNLSYVLVIMPDRKAMCIGINKSRIFNISTFIAMNKIAGYKLYLFTPSWIELLPDSGNVFLPLEFTQFNSDYRLQFLPSSYPHYVLRFYPKCEYNDIFNIWNIGINKTDKNSFKDILNAFNISFCCKFISLSFDIGNLSLTNSILSQKDKIKKQKIYLNIHITQNEAKLLKRRIQILKEIITTEGEYVKNLQQVTENFTEQFFIGHHIDVNIYRRTIKSIFEIYPLHHQFYKTLRSAGDGIESSMGSYFVEYIPYFKVAVPHVANFSSANLELQELMETNKHFEKAVTQMCIKTFDGKSVDSLLVTPVQRIPRYPLLLRDLKNATCENHWDYTAVSLAYKNIQNLVQEIDKKTKDQKNLNTINALQEKFGKDYNCFAIGRQHIKTIDTTSLVHQDKVTLYLFNDLLLYQNQSNFKEFQLINTKFKRDNESIAFYDKRNKVTLTISQEMILFLENFIVTKKQYLINKCSFGGSLKWIIEKENGPPPLHSPSMVSICEDLFLFGGRMENGLASNELWYYHKNKWFLLKTINPPKPRFNCSLNAFENQLVVFGGQDGENVFSDLLIFNIATLKWEEITNNKGKPSPRFAHATALSENQLWIFGGKNINEYFNDFYCYDFSIDKWYNIITPKKPDPRAWHSAFWINDSITGNINFAIFGGAHQRAYCDIWMFNYDSVNWEQIITKGDSPGVRYAHVSLVIDNKLYVIGGKNMAEAKFMDPYTLNLEKKPYVWSILPQIDEPETFAFGTGACVNNHEIILYQKNMWKIHLSFPKNQVERKVTHIKNKSLIEKTLIAYPIYNPRTKMVSTSFNRNEKFNFDIIFDEKEFLSIIHKDENQKMKWKKKFLLQNCDEKMEDETDGGILYIETEIQENISPQIISEPAPKKRQIKILTPFKENKNINKSILCETPKHNQNKPKKFIYSLDIDKKIDINLTPSVRPNIESRRQIRNCPSTPIFSDKKEKMTLKEKIEFFQQLQTDKT